jgi:hypothetical protein
MPAGGFGNLIALPLQSGPRQKGNSVFVDDGLHPYVPRRPGRCDKCSAMPHCSEHSFSRVIRVFFRRADHRREYLRTFK